MTTTKSQLTNAYEYGYAYAMAMRGEDGFDRLVDVDRMVNASVSLPEGDYLGNYIFNSLC
jgi:hypothetical protein